MIKNRPLPIAKPSILLVNTRYDCAPVVARRFAAFCILQCGAEYPAIKEFAEVYAQYHAGAIDSAVYDEAVTRIKRTKQCADYSAQYFAQVAAIWATHQNPITAADWAAHHAALSLGEKNERFVYGYASARHQQEDELGRLIIQHNSEKVVKRELD
jgi:hypothetical protein